MLRNFLFFSLSILFAACGQAEADTATIDVKGVKCDMCVANITNALNEVDGVTQVDIDLKAKTAAVKYIPAKVTVARLEKTIAAAGYDANSVARDEAAFKALPACCQ